MKDEKLYQQSTNMNQSKEHIIKELKKKDFGVGVLANNGAEMQVYNPFPPSNWIDTGIIIW